MQSQYRLRRLFSRNWFTAERFCENSPRIHAQSLLIPNAVRLCWFPSCHEQSKKASYSCINFPCSLIHEGVFLSPLLLYNVAMNILQQIFSDHYKEIKYTFKLRPATLENIEKWLSMPDTRKRFPEEKPIPIILNGLPICFSTDCFATASFQINLRESFSNWFLTKKPCRGKESGTEPFAKKCWKAATLRFQVPSLILMEKCT